MGGLEDRIKAAAKDAADIGSSTFDTGSSALDAITYPDGPDPVDITAYAPQNEVDKQRAYIAVYTEEYIKDQTAFSTLDKKLKALEKLELQVEKKAKKLRKEVSDAQDEMDDVDEVDDLADDIANTFGDVDEVDDEETGGYNALSKKEGKDVRVNLKELKRKLHKNENYEVSLDGVMHLLNDGITNGDVQLEKNKKYLLETAMDLIEQAMDQFEDDMDYNKKQIKKAQKGLRRIKKDKMKILKGGGRRQPTPTPTPPPSAGRSGGGSSSTTGLGK